MDESDLRVDGNAAGGILQTIFPFEMTTAKTVCAGCGATEPVGALLVYAQAMGTVIRCPHCDTVQIRVSQHSGAYWLDLRGASCLQIPEE